jgi:transcription elongation factor Elf1
VKPGTARRLRKVATEDTGTVVCGQCGQRFAIEHEGVRDAQLAEKQVAWLQDQLVWDHIQERKHHANFELPALS